MTTSIEFFLTQCVQQSEKDGRGWEEWYVLDSERLHQDILHILFNTSPEFSRSLFGLTCECTRQPERGMFDLGARLATGDKVFIEIKCDQRWSKQQKEKQADFLRKIPRAKCALILFSQEAARTKRSDVLAVGDQFFKITYNEIYEALDAVRHDATSAALIEFADGYKVALTQQEQRTREWYRRYGDPGA